MPASAARVQEPSFCLLREQWHLPVCVCPCLSFCSQSLTISVLVRPTFDSVTGRPDATCYYAPKPVGSDCGSDRVCSPQAECVGRPLVDSARTGDVLTRGSTALPCTVPDNCNTYDASECRGWKSVPCLVCDPGFTLGPDGNCRIDVRTGLPVHSSAVELLTAAQTSL